MVGLSSLFDIARSALTTTQLALTVTGHNVANVNTPGFSRQEAVLSERPPNNGSTSIDSSIASLRLLSRTWVASRPHARNSSGSKTFSGIRITTASQPD
jgi:flagellar hook-associated protein 1 FlgK